MTMMHPAKNLRITRFAYQEPDGTTRPMLALRAERGSPLVLIEFSQARALVDVVHDKCDEHERALKEGTK